MKRAVHKTEVSNLINYDFQMVSKVFAQQKSQKALLIGVDEVGRGSIAGPVTTAAVCYQDFLDSKLIFKELEILNQIQDSKKIKSNHKRKELVSFIKNKVSYAVDFIEPKEIDRIGILKATLLSMRNSVFALFSQLEFPEKTLVLVLVDGNSRIERLEKDLLESISKEEKKNVRIQQITQKKADALSFHVACASNLAKFERDLFLEELCQRFPGYLLSKHKGYGTKEHFQQIKKLGISPVHRKSFLEKFLLKEKAVQLSLLNI